MNEILAKAVEALKEEQPNIDYVRGMLETLLAMNPSSPNVPALLPNSTVISVPPMVGEVPMPMNIAAIKAMADASAHD